MKCLPLLKRAKPAMRTWASEYKHVYFVIEFSEATSQEFSKPDCIHQEVKKKTGHEEAVNRQSVVECKDSKPVLLVKCSNEYWGKNGPCCKCEEALKFAVSIPQYGTTTSTYWISYMHMLYV